MIQMRTHTPTFGIRLDASALGKMPKQVDEGVKMAREELEPVGNPEECVKLMVDNNNVTLSIVSEDGTSATKPQILNNLSEFRQQTPHMIRNLIVAGQSFAEPLPMQRIAK
jgi:hypothetical protein